ncbi:MAG: hypothetical protein AAGG75_02810 [Bacteroidota bacterium]
MNQKKMPSDDSEIQIPKQRIRTLYRSYLSVLLVELNRQSMGGGMAANEAIIVDFIRSTFCCKRSEEIAEIIKTNNVRLIQQKFRDFIKRRRDII